MDKSTLSRLLGYTRPYRKFIIIAFICSVLQVVATLIGPFLIGKMIDLMFGPGQVAFDRLPRYFILFGMSVIVGSIAQWGVSRSTNALSYFTVQDLRNDMMAKINELPLATLDVTAHGKMISLMIADIELISTGLLNGGAQFLTGILTIIGTIGLMFYTQVNITILVLILTPISLVVAQFIAKGVYQKYQEQSTIRGELTGYVEEMIGNEQLVKNFSYEKRSQEVLKEINNRLYDAGWLGHFYGASMNPSTRLVNNIIYVCVGVYGAILVRGDALTVGALSAFLTYANQYMKPFNEISNVMTELQAALASSTRVFEVLDLPDAVPDAPNSVPIENVDGHVVMEDVSFSYVPEKPFIEHMSFNAKAGQTFAVVGPTGCGKTTLINLLMRFYERNGGTYTIDNQDTDYVTKESLRHQYGMVLQDTWIFTGTVAENIAYGKPSASREEIMEAAQKAEIHHAIEQLPHGYDTMLSSKHELLSQGQQQLLCIARMMLLDPPMLILDEATSNIDTRTELAIQRTFDEMMIGRTSFIIAHRLSTIQNADVILVMKDGKIIEQGSHDELLAVEGGFYNNLYNSQFQQNIG